MSQRFGGSHAQRDLLELTLIEAAIRGGCTALAQRLAAQRRAARPTSLLARRLQRRAAAAG